jgi:hypothetical protein
MRNHQDVAFKCVRNPGWITYEIQNPLIRFEQGFPGWKPKRIRIILPTAQYFRPTSLYLLLSKTLPVTEINLRQSRIDRRAHSPQIRFD